jgi:uncharacterized membrane protein
VIIFFGSFYLVNLILAIVSMSYLDQQQKVAAENVENERRKIEDELEVKNEEIRKALEVQQDENELDNNDEAQISEYSSSIITVKTTINMNSFVCYIYLID